MTKVPFRKLEYNSTISNMLMERVLSLGIFFGVEGVKRFVKDHLYCIVRNLKNDERNVDVATHQEKIFADTHGSYSAKYQL